ncbi:hypothetical protein DFH07DRAFT_51850 [Mycena maculata]|uniref:Uncharacterized protein n=1 Tax=Mycena maculata TaxID=230809 RepID=A0AAD7IFA7_9AGAR|nr:hypothetical protein DFH07DRAFT_51850 [Mycena maculata]
MHDSVPVVTRAVHVGRICIGTNAGALSPSTGLEAVHATYIPSAEPTPVEFGQDMDWTTLRGRMTRAAHVGSIFLDRPPAPCRHRQGWTPCMEFTSPAPNPRLMSSDRIWTGRLTRPMRARLRICLYAATVRVDSTNGCCVFGGRRCGVRRNEEPGGSRTNSARISPLSALRGARRRSRHAPCNSTQTNLRPSWMIGSIFSCLVLFPRSAASVARSCSRCPLRRCRVLFFGRYTYGSASPPLRRIEYAGDQFSSNRVRGWSILSFIFHQTPSTTTIPHPSLRNSLHSIPIPFPTYDIRMSSFIPSFHPLCRAVCEFRTPDAR